MIQIRCQHSSGFEVRIECDSLDEAEALMAVLVKKGYRSVNATNEWPKGPDGSPLYPKHNAVMQKRQMQGDEWYSHKLVHPTTGTELYCRGYRHGPAEKDGYLVEG